MGREKPIYLDYCATTPVDPEVLEAMLPYFSHYFGNAASRTHYYGLQAERAVNIARKRVASLIKSYPEEIIFTSGATESINLALKGILPYAEKKKKDTILSSPTEHKAVLDTLEAISKRGIKVKFLRVNQDGVVEPDELKKHLDSSVLGVCLMFANNETGVIHPIQTLCRLSKEAGALFICDATQAVGKINVDVRELGIDLMAFSAHKLYGPKGIGALYVRQMEGSYVPLEPLLHGGGHERGLRSGTLNVPAIVGFGKAALLAGAKMEEEGKRLKTWRDWMEARLKSELGVTIHGEKAERLPHVSNVYFPSHRAKEIIQLLPELAIATGSACTSAHQTPSHVLEAMGYDKEHILNSIRISLGRMLTLRDLEESVYLFIKRLKRVKSYSMGGPIVT